MDIYKKRLQRKYPNCKIEITTKDIYDPNINKDDGGLNWTSYTLWVQGKAVKTFRTFRDFVDGVLYLTQDDEILVEV